MLHTKYMGVISSFAVTHRQPSEHPSNVSAQFASHQLIVEDSNTSQSSTVSQRGAPQLPMEVNRASQLLKAVHSFTTSQICNFTTAFQQLSSSTAQQLDNSAAPQLCSYITPTMQLYNSTVNLRLKLDHNLSPKSKTRAT